MDKTQSAQKTAIVIFSDPKPASEESFDRVFNALAVAHEAKESGDEVAVVFAGAGTRWPAELTKPDHPAHGLYQAVRDTVRGASCGCAAVFGSTEGVEAAGIPLVRDHALPGTPGVLSLHRDTTEGWNTLVF